MKKYKAIDYKLSDFDFELPSNLIAQTPSAKRTQSKLLCYDGSKFLDKKFIDILDYLEKDDVLVLNNTKVIPARLFGEKKTGGKLEIFVERIQSENVAVCMIRSNHTPKIGSEITISNDFEKAIIKDRKGLFFIISLLNNNVSWEKLINKNGEIPLPPYITRNTNDSDLDRYQTVYAKNDGAVAAPTAGLHFDESLLTKIKEKGVKITYVTLHVGAGTFQPVKTENLEEHQMHFELFEIPEATVSIVNKAKEQGKNIIAVGTTSLRALESSANNGRLEVLNGDTNLFIRPGFEFQIVDKLITNFHLPKSSLMMLVSAFFGYTEIKNLYSYAIDNDYRFFSYGDAMLLVKKLI